MPVQVTGRYEKIWKPHDIQAEFVSLPFEFFEALYGGAAGGGKSELLLMLPILYGFHDISGFNGIIFRKTFPQLEASLILRSHGFYKYLGGRYNDQKHVWTFPSTATIRFSYMENDQDARDHDTAEYHYAGFDELTAFGSFQYHYITSRVRSSIPGIPPLIRAASNPGNVGHVWVRDKFVAPAPFGRVRIKDENSKTNRIFIPAKLTDNPYLQESDPGYGDRLKLLPEAEQRAKILGDWWVFSGQVFGEWRDPYTGTKFADEPSNACHVVPDFDPPIWWPRVVAADWGFTAKTWVGWGAVSPDKRLFLYREYCKDKLTIAEWGADVRRLSQSELEANALRLCVLDPSAWARRGEQKTLAIQIAEATGMHWERADNDRIGGKLWFHEMLRWKQKPPSRIPKGDFSMETFEKILRMQGPEIATHYFEQYQAEKPETYIPRLQVCVSCKYFREAIPACIYDEKDGQVIEDVKEFNGDDPYDGGRYLIKAFQRLESEAVRKGEQVTALGEIIQRLESTKDWNTYYRQMRLYEKKAKGFVQAVNRGRRRGVHFVAH